jgi:hypothetical protein
MARGTVCELTRYSKGCDCNMNLENALAHYYPQLQATLSRLAEEADDGVDEFTPGLRLPDLTAPVRSYLSVSGLVHSPIAEYHGHQLSILDLTRNPATRTTKTFPSLVMVARAVEFIRETGQRVTIVTPSSANKAVALRDAVLRAITCGLVGSDELNIVSIIPIGSVHKLRSTELSADADLRLRNPVCIYNGSSPATVKSISCNVVKKYRSLIESVAKTNIWYTLKLANYLGADVIRAYAENDYFPPESGRTRVHAHSVSSAYGLLGHAYGRQLLGTAAVGAGPGYFLVQHLGAPDMVSALYHGQPGGFGTPPAYTYDGAQGVYRQQSNPHFPQVALDPAEVLDPTFYSRNPPTIPRMTELIRTRGGGGIVVSRAECLNRFDEVREFLRTADIELPANPELIQEWSLLMVITGVLNAIDREIVEVDEIVIHGSGVYFQDGSEPIKDRHLHSVDGDEALRDVIVSAGTL